MNESWPAEHNVLTLPGLLRDGRAGAVVVGGMRDVEGKESKKLSVGNQASLVPFLENDSDFYFFIFFVFPIYGR